MRLVIQKLFLASDEAFKKLRSSLSRHNICRGRFKFGELDGHFSSASFATVVEQHDVVQCAHCAQRSMHLAESAAQAGSSRMQSSIHLGSRN